MALLSTCDKNSLNKVGAIAEGGATGQVFPPTLGQTEDPPVQGPGVAVAYRVSQVQLKRYFKKLS